MSIYYAHCVNKIPNHNPVWFHIDQINPSVSEGGLQLQVKFYKGEKEMWVQLK